MQPNLPRRCTRDGLPPQLTLINVNLMLVNAHGSFDQEAYLPLGLLYLAGQLEREGHSVELVDYQTFSQARTFDAELFVEALGQPAPIVGLSCMSNLLPFTIHLARSLKREHPGCRIVLGGVGPSPVAREIIEAFPFVDTVVEGEGELALLDIAAGSREPLPPPRPPPALDQLALPAYSLVDFSLYDAAPSVITSRGCPYRCQFCTEPYNFGGTVRFRDIDVVLAEIEQVHRLSGRTRFLFQDDILPLDRGRFRRLLQGLRRLPFSIEWKCFSRVDLMDEELMREMVDSGCVQVRYGIESGSNRTLARIEKGFTIEQAYEVAVASLRRFPAVHASFIWGYPFEELAEFEETLDWVTRFEEAGISVLLFEFAPLPGSPLYKEHREDLTFARDQYSFFVVTGHEVVSRQQYATRDSFEPIYQLIADHPQIFSGFFQYEQTRTLAKRQRLAQYHVRRRTPVRAVHDR